MDRRQFIQTFLAGLLPITSHRVLLQEVERVFEETSHMNDNEFIKYMITQGYIYLNNPRMCAVITNIGECDG